MKRKLIFLLTLCLATTMTKAEQVVLQTKNTTMVLNVENGKQPQYVYYGTKLSNYDLQHLQMPVNGRMDAYPVYGLNGGTGDEACRRQHVNGSLCRGH